MFRPTSVFLLLTAALVATGCSNQPATPTTPTTPTAITEPVFSGTLSRNGAATYPFVANTGTITATLTTLTPEGTVVTLALGEWNATTSSCQLRITADDAVQSKVLIGSAQLTANYCVRIADATGQLAAPATYEITVSHF